MQSMLDQVKIMGIEEVKLVNKPWGWEKWIAHGQPDFPYALKEIHIRAPYKSSLQFHEFKRETNYVQKGRGFLHYSDIPVDIKRFVNQEYTPEELEELIDSVRKKEIIPGSVFHVCPLFLHRVEAVVDLYMIESSTTELDDVFRLQDDSGRNHGRIESEHKR
jgi:hypothetical protein